MPKINLASAAHPPPPAQKPPAGRSIKVPRDDFIHRDLRIGGEGELARRVGVGVPARLWCAPPAAAAPTPASPDLFGA